jgi:integrase
MSVFDSHGKYYAKVSVGSGERRSVALPLSTTREDAEVRDKLMAELIAALHKAGAASFLDETIAQVATKPAAQLAAVRAYVLDKLCTGRLVSKERTAGMGLTFQDLGEQWTSGELARQYPDHVREKRSAQDDVWRLEKHVYPRIGNVPIAAFRLEHAEAVMAKLPRSLTSASRRQIAQVMGRLMKLAVYPCRLIGQNPIPEGFLPPVRNRKAFAYLYPAEDAALMGCEAVPLVHRVLYGVLAREGLRREEAASLTWASINLALGTVTLGEHKTADEAGARTWALDEGTAEALRRWRKLHPKARRVFAGPGGKALYVLHLAEQLRAHLELAGVTRPELLEGSRTSQRLRVHDLRGTFVTLALAAGRSEAWVMDRTGHTTSGMLQRYRRAARTAAELKLGQLAPLHLAIPELAKLLPVCGARAGCLRSRGEREGA